MHDSSKESIVKKIIILTENAQDIFARDGERIKFVSSAEVGISYSLIDGNVDLFDEIVRDLLIKNKWNDKFSEKYVISQIQSIVGKVIKDRDSQKASDYFDQLVEDYESYSKEQILYLPLFGVELLGDQLMIGNVILEKIDEKHKEKIISQLTSIIKKNTKTKDEKKIYLEYERTDIERNLKDKTCAVIKVVAEPERALEIAELETQRIVDLLRYAIPAIYSANKRVVVGLQGEYSRQIRFALIISSIGDAFTITNQVVGPLYTFELTQANIEHMKKIGVFTLGEVLEKEKLNSFEETLLLAIEWFSRAQTQSESKNKLLNLITVLETFLTRSGGAPIQTSIAEGVAILLQDDVRERKKLVERVKKLYGLRSTFSHGRQEKILDMDTRELTSIAGSLIKTLIEMKDTFESKNDLLNWVEYRRLGGLPDNWEGYKDSLNKS